MNQRASWPKSTSTDPSSILAPFAPFKDKLLVLSPQIDNTHSNWALPNILLGGTGGYFKMGRVLQLPATSATKVLIAIGNAMGVDVPTLGKGQFMDTAPLAGLTG